ncbi:MAG: hypothetical protein SOU07_02180 [Bacilli bacterium]|nr:hypothetical protein [Bacilli bacterium]
MTIKITLNLSNTDYYSYKITIIDSKDSSSLDIKSSHTIEIGKVLIVKLKNVKLVDTANSLTITNGSILEATFTQENTFGGWGDPKEFTYTWSSFKGTLIISS